MAFVFYLPAAHQTSLRCADNISKMCPTFYPTIFPNFKVRNFLRSCSNLMLNLAHFRQSSNFYDLIVFIYLSLVVFLSFIHIYSFYPRKTLDKRVLFGYVTDWISLRSVMRVSGDFYRERATSSKLIGLQ